MQNPNPYECSQSFVPHTAANSTDYTRYLIAMSPGLVVIVVAATKYAAAARSLDGALAGSILIVVGWAVGRELARESTSRAIALVMSATFATAMCFGWIDHPGGELTLWAFSCMCAGILSAGCAPSPEYYPPAEVVDVELLPTGIDDTSLRN